MAGDNDTMLLLFDYDGVIVDSFDALLAVCVEAQADLGRGRAPAPEDFRTIENLTFEELGRAIGLADGDTGPYAERVFALQRKRWSVRPFPDIVDVLAELAERHTLAVVTSSHGRIVASALEEFGLGAAIAAVTGGESGTTKAVRIARLREAHAAARESTCMIGDTAGDIRAGKEAGVRTAAVTWGFQPRDLLARESPDFILDGPDDLRSMVRGTEGPRSPASAQ